MTVIRNWHVRYVHLYTAGFLAVFILWPVQAFSGIAEILSPATGRLPKKIIPLRKNSFPRPWKRTRKIFAS